MAKKIKGRPLLYHALAAGAAGICLRMILYRTGFDQRGLLDRADPLHIICCLLALTLAVRLLIALRGPKKFSLKLPAALRTGAAVGSAVLLGVNLVRLFPVSGDTLTLVRIGAGSLCCVAICFEVLSPTRAERVGTPLRALVCLFFALDTLCRYQGWSGNPQLPDYCFALPASVFLCICAYQRLALPVELGSRKVHFFAGLMGLCLCLFSLVGTGSPLHYLSGALWILSGLGSHRPRRREGQEAPVPEQIAPQKS